MTRIFFSPVWLVALASLLLSGCSLTLDTDKKQCKTSKNCTELFGGDTTYVCTKNFCTKPSCKTDAECQSYNADSRFVNSICGSSADVAAGGALSCEPAECTEADDDCGEGNACDTETKRCRKAECMAKAECGTSPTVDCKGGMCQDPTWGCLATPDTRNPETAGDPILKIQVLYAFAQGGATATAVKDFGLTVCRVADIACTSPVNVTYAYDTDTGWLTVTSGLENRNNYRLRFTGTHPGKDHEGEVLLEQENYLYRTVVGETVIPKPVLMFESAVIDQLSFAAGVPVDHSLGIVIVRVFDCNDVEVEGVQLSIDKNANGCQGTPDAAKCVTSIFYFDVTNLPDPDASQTNAAGRAGVVNMAVNTFNRLELTRAADNKEITAFRITPRPNVVTGVWIFPQDYGTSVE